MHSSYFVYRCFSGRLQLFVKFKLLFFSSHFLTCYAFCWHMLCLLLAHFEKHENLNKNAFLVKLRYTKKNCVKLFKHTALFHPFLVFNLRSLLKLQTCIMFLIRPNINARVFLVFNSPYCPLICCLIGLLTTTAVQLDAAL